VGGDSLFETIELRHCGAPGNALFVGLHGFAARKKAATIGYDGWPGELSVRRKRWVIQYPFAISVLLQPSYACSIPIQSRARSRSSCLDRRPLRQLPIGA
jgi:hypothetical protein